MIVAQFDDSGYVKAFEVATLSQFAETYQPRDEGWVFVDMPPLWNDTLWGQFMNNPSAFYLDVLGRLTLDSTV